MKVIKTCYIFSFLLFAVLASEAIAISIVCEVENSSTINFNYRTHPWKNVYLEKIHFNDENRQLKKIFMEKYRGFLIVISYVTKDCDCSIKIVRRYTKSGRSYLVEICDCPTEICRKCKYYENYVAVRYTKERGYEEWHNVSEEEWKSIISMDHIFSSPPDFYYENCHRSRILEFLQLSVVDLLVLLKLLPAHWHSF